jgi:uncharacterized protein YyaL (SSP411 family)
MNQQTVHTNRLIDETSPYLRQHAHNPVDWYPWGEEALRKARELDRPIFLSIGYSACHWCHVMEHESFEDPEIGRLLNENFISIKVDREERPDLDQIYMTAVQLLTQHGGWPMSVFLTPEGKPFYAGTYFPPDDRYGGQLPSFRRVVQNIARAWKEKRADIEGMAEQLTEQLRLVSRIETGQANRSADLLRGAAARLRQSFDPAYGGFGQAPKFPHPMDLRVLLRVWKRFGDDEALEMARKTLRAMALGGIYDHLGGGFHRYSTDRRWLVPHFEKMLYDNALLTIAYLEGFQATADPLFRDVAEQTLDYVRREMTSPEGPFYSTQDADSEGQEGKFYVWSAEEVRSVLGGELADIFAAVYDVSDGGNWEGRNILNRARTDAQDAALLGLDEDVLRRKLEEARRKLYEARSRRVRPGRDEKVLTAWNGLMISAFAQAAQVLGTAEYAQVAVRAADFLLKRMRRPDGRLYRTWSAGSEPKLNGYLEDHAFLLDGLVSLYEATFDPRWIRAALELAQVLSEQFWDSAEGGFFYTGRDHEQLLARTKDAQDSSVPSGNSMAATALLRLARLAGRTELQEKALATLRAFSGLLSAAPQAVGQLLIALDFHLGPVQEFAIVGDLASAQVQEVLRIIHGGFRPNKVVALKGLNTPKEAEELMPLLADKPISAEVTTYVCENFTCQTPLVGAEALREQLGREPSAGAKTA